MSEADATISGVLMDRVGTWLMRTALAGTDIKEMVPGFFERLAAAGLPLTRIHLTFSVLHPLYRATGFTWLRGKGTESESYRHATEDRYNYFKKSPYYYLLNNKLDHLRRRIDPMQPSEFSIFDDLKELGITDYMAFVQPFDAGSSQGMMGSWATDRPEGFSDSAIAALLDIQNQLAVAIKMAVLSKLAGNMLTTYLGSDAGRRVLSGQIKRGDGETIRAALVMADMRNSTAIADQHGRQVYIDTLNEFYDAVGAPFHRDGGQILSFIGDGFLAAYPCDRHKSQSQIACRAALAAAGIAAGRMAKLNRERKSRGVPEIGYGIGLHVGNVMFGNVGLADRLTFSTFGAAVNEVQRLEALTKKYDTKIVASEAFANYCGGEWIKAGIEKLRGTDRAVKLFVPSAASLAAAKESAAAEAGERMSDAEQLLMLHRESQKEGTRQSGVN